MRSSKTILAIIAYLFKRISTLNMKTTKQVKNLIIGFGKAGKTLAAFLAKQNESVAINGEFLKR